MWPGSARVPIKGTVVFRWTRYNPGVSRRTEAQQAEDILSFCLAYVASPEAFDRGPDEPEQEHAKFWRAYGEAFDFPPTEDE